MIYNVNQQAKIQSITVNVTRQLNNFPFASRSVHLRPSATRLSGIVEYYVSLQQLFDIYVPRRSPLTGTQHAARHDI